MMATLALDQKLDSAVALIRAGRRGQGKKLLLDILKQDETQDMAWVWLSATVDTVEMRRECLEEALKHNPENRMARRGLDRLEAQQPAGVPAPGVAPAASATTTSGQVETPAFVADHEPPAPLPSASRFFGARYDDGMATAAVAESSLDFFAAEAAAPADPGLSGEDLVAALSDPAAETADAATHLSPAEQAARSHAGLRRKVAVLAQGREKLDERIVRTVAFFGDRDRLARRLAARGIFTYWEAQTYIDAVAHRRQGYVLALRLGVAAAVSAAIALLVAIFWALVSSGSASGEPNGVVTFLGLLFLGLGLVTSLVSSIWYVIAAFSADVLWGLGVLFLPPVSVLFLIFRADKAARPFVLGLVGLVFTVLGLSLTFLL